MGTLIIESWEINTIILGLKHKELYEIKFSRQVNKIIKELKFGVLTIEFQTTRISTSLIHTQLHISKRRH